MGVVPIDGRVKSYKKAILCYDMRYESKGVMGGINHDCIWFR